jgi:hypothetical protein
MSRRERPRCSFLSGSVPRASGSKRVAVHRGLQNQALILRIFRDLSTSLAVRLPRRRTPVTLISATLRRPATRRPLQTLPSRLRSSPPAFDRPRRLAPKGHGLWISESADLSDSRGCACNEAFAVVVYLRKSFAAALIELVAIAANFPHQVSGLLKRDVVLLGEVVSVIGLWIYSARCWRQGRVRPYLGRRESGSEQSE